MPRIDVPEGRDPMAHTWAHMAVPLTSAAAHLSETIYTKTSLSLREFEAARIKIAHLNDCNVCRNYRTARDVPGVSDDPNAVPEEFYERVFEPTWPGYSEREQLAIEFAERFSLDHTGMDDAFWDRMHAAYTDDEIVDMAICVGTLVALGRVNRVLEIDGACQISPEVLRSSVDAARNAS
jgi:alkylhydroperoxidase family enzyme